VDRSAEPGGVAGHTSGGAHGQVEGSTLGRALPPQREGVIAVGLSLLGLNQRRALRLGAEQGEWISTDRCIILADASARGET
jgi:hypothetical protein